MSDTRSKEAFHILFHSSQPVTTQSELLRNSHINIKRQVKFVSSGFSPLQVRLNRLCEFTPQRKTSSPNLYQFVPKTFDSFPRLLTTERIHFLSKFPSYVSTNLQFMYCYKKPLGGKLTKTKRKRTWNRAKSLVTIKLHRWYRTSQVVRQLPSRAPLLNFNIKYKIVFLWDQKNKMSPKDVLVITCHLTWSRPYSTGRIQTHLEDFLSVICKTFTPILNQNPLKL